MIYSYEEGVDTDMRLRNVKGSRETIAANPLVICDITEKKDSGMRSLKIQNLFI